MSDQDDAPSDTRSTARASPPRLVFAIAASCHGHAVAHVTIGDSVQQRASRLSRYGFDLPQTDSQTLLSLAENAGH